MKNAYEHLASLLGVSSKVIENMERGLASAVGSGPRFVELSEEIEKRIRHILTACNLDPNESFPEKIWGAIKRSLISEEEELKVILREPVFSSEEGCRTLLNITHEISGRRKGFYLKKNKAREFLLLNPPRNIMQFLGYGSIEDLVRHEKIEEIFAALRFVEEREWLNAVFFKPYENLQESDFEERAVETHVLSLRWVQAGAYFSSKKLHHVSHLKELGTIFILPFENNYAGSLLEIFTLVAHYFHEVDFYAKLFFLYRDDPASFGKNIARALSGSVPEGPLPSSGGFTFRIVQRYLAKESTDDPRLYEPHVNPEALHWARAIDDLARFTDRFDGGFFSLFKSGDFAAKQFNEDLQNPTIFSFDLIDLIISLTKESTTDNLFSYHEREGLWNKLFETYLGKEKLEELVIDNLHQGYITLNPKY